MAKSKLKSLRKSTGGRYSKLYRKKKLRDSMGIPVLTTISEKVVSKISFATSQPTKLYLFLFSLN